MRLLNCYTFELKEFVSETPLYYILSHRWGDDEVSYKEFRKGRVTNGVGYDKVVSFCAFVRDQQHKLRRELISSGRIFDDVTISWVWIDTCCIDKRSSAELSEAINSMWKWYSAAMACIAYLPDVPSIAQVGRDEALRCFRSSDWFTRGWTLQELLAPDLVFFCTVEWEVLGHKHTERDEDVNRLTFVRDVPYLHAEIRAITGIHAEYINGREDVHDASIARRMSWAARRKTTRAEDRAYCLLGILQINMPLLYGEGPMAYRRLLEELIRRKSDQSIFAWVQRLPLSQLGGLLAKGPEDFAMSGAILRVYTMPCLYTLTNRGVEFQCKGQRLVREKGRAIEDDDPNKSKKTVIWLNCVHAVDTGELEVEESLPSQDLFRGLIVIQQRSRSSETKRVDDVAPYFRCWSDLSVIELHQRISTWVVEELELATYVVYTDFP